MKNKKDNILYVFFHMPKCAGTTMRFHIQKNLNNNERLYISHELLGLDPSNPPIRPIDYINANNKYFKKLSKNARDQLKVVYGHYVSYGIHQYFNQEVRYFTFLRDPIDQIISLYKYIVQLYLGNYPEAHRNVNFNTILLINGHVPLFNIWLKNKYNLFGEEGGISSLSMHNTFRLYGYIDNKENIRESDLINNLKNFYFIGIREKFKEESLFLFSKLGFHKYFFDKNISEYNVDINMEREEISKYLDNNDIATIKIYNLALKINKEFKDKTEGYYNTVRIKKIERKIFLPITQMFYSPRNTFNRLYRNIIEGDSLFSSSREK